MYALNDLDILVRVLLLQQALCAATVRAVGLREHRDRVLIHKRLGKARQQISLHELSEMSKTVKDKASSSQRPEYSRYSEDWEGPVYPPRARWV